jgi:hypothetical protein
MEAISPYTFDWRNARGWLSEEEAAELARLADGKVVLEVGTFCGRSTLAMAETARKIFCVDNFKGYPGVHSPTRDEALGNFDRAGVNGKVAVLQGSQEDVLPLMTLRDIDVVFYDADHSREGTAAGIRLLHEAGLPESATLAFHDYSDGNPGVVLAVNDFCGPIGKKPRTVGTLAIFDGTESERTESEATECYEVMLGIPTDDQAICYGAAQGLFRATWKHNVRIAPADSSLLANAFNRLWCQALNESEKGTITHLAFLHSDIAPADGWIDTLIEEMEIHDAAFCSVVSPLKDTRGLTSTAIGEPGLAWSPLRRLTMREIMKLPETFDAETAGFPDKVLLLNSGCWVADLRNPAFHVKNADNEAELFFTVNDRVVYTDGKWVQQVESEDWFFSRAMHRFGVRAMATRRVKLHHLGMASFVNSEAWGTQECDEDLRALWENPQHVDN